MNIKHRPNLDVDRVAEYYSKKDGVPIKYVCTTALESQGLLEYDVFYRDTPHPEFGNKYFGLTVCREIPYIGNADRVEELTFNMVKVDDTFHYSKSRHDFYNIGPVAIDGGRAYTRILGDAKMKVETFVVSDGEFVIDEKSNL